MLELHADNYPYSLIKIKIKYFLNMLILQNLIKPVNFEFLMGPISTIFGGVGVFVFYAVHGCWCEC
jgi:hypothetical protein